MKAPASTAGVGALNGRRFGYHTRIIREARVQKQSVRDDVNGRAGVSVVIQWERLLIKNREIRPAFCPFVMTRIRRFPGATEKRTGVYVFFL